MPDLVVERHGGADVFRKRVQRLADVKLLCARGFDHDVLLAVHDDARIRNLRESDTHPERILGGDSLVAKVQRQEIHAGFAHDAGKQCCGDFERQVCKFLAVTPIPKHGRAGRTLAISAGRVERESRRASGDEHGRIESGSQPGDCDESSLAFRAPRFG